MGFGEYRIVAFRAIRMTVFGDGITAIVQWRPQLQVRGVTTRRIVAGVHHPGCAGVYAIMQEITDAVSLD